jgi:hypothetical protein
MRATSCTALFAHSRAISGGAIGDFPTYVVEHFSWPRFLSIQVWLMVLFLVYVHELNISLASDELHRSIGKTADRVRHLL